MNIDGAFPSNYLKASDLQNKAVTVAIDRVEIEELKSRNGSDTKPVLYFQGKDKGLVLNRTNSRVISQLYGTETEDWQGQKVELYTAMVDFAGDTVEAIRVRAPRRQNGAERPVAQPAPARMPIDDDLSDSIPF